MPTKTVRLPFSIVPLASLILEPAFLASLLVGYFATLTFTSTCGLSHIIYVTLDAYDRYLDVTGAVFDNRTGIPRITPEQFKKLKSLFFEIDGVTYELIPNAQIWPRALNTLLGGEVDSVYLVVSDLGPEVSGTFKLDFIIGMTVLERFYSVFDTTNERVGLATTRFTYANIN